MYFEFDKCIFYIADICGGEYYADINGHKHSRNGFELHYDVYGKGLLITEDAEYTLKENLLYITGPEKYHRQTFDRTDPLFEYSILIELVKYEKSKLSDIFLQKNFWIGNAGANIGILFQKIAETNLSEHKCGEIEIKALFNLLLAEIIRLYAPDLKENRKGVTSSRNKTIESNFIYACESITLETLSRRLGLSQRQCERVIKKNFGKNFSQMKKEYQIAKAIGLFETDMSIEKISEECGFCDTSAFYRAFKQTKNMTPVKYRKNTE